MKGENFPQHKEKIILPDSAAKLITPFIPKIQEEIIDYRIELRCSGRKLNVFESHSYRETEYKYKKLRREIIRQKSIIEVVFWSNDFMVDKFKKDE